MNVTVHGEQLDEPETSSAAWEVTTGSAGGTLSEGCAGPRYGLTDDTIARTECHHDEARTAFFQHGNGCSQGTRSGRERTDACEGMTWPTS